MPGLRWPPASWATYSSPSESVIAGTKLDFSKSSYSTSEKQTPLNDITHYNNYYEFSTDKYEPAELAKNFNPRPWTVKVEGLVNKPKTFDIDTLLKLHLEERIYRMRCVEGWSMVIPWIGFPLSALLEPGASRTPRPSSSNSRRSTIPSAFPDSSAACSTGPTSRACGWTKPCIR